MNVPPLIVMLPLAATTYEYAPTAFPTSRPSALNKPPLIVTSSFALLLYTALWPTYVPALTISVPPFTYKASPSDADIPPLPAGFSSVAVESMTVSFAPLPILKQREYILTQLPLRSRTTSSPSVMLSWPLAVYSKFAYITIVCGPSVSAFLAAELALLRASYPYTPSITAAKSLYTAME